VTTILADSFFSTARLKGNSKDRKTPIVDRMTDRRCGKQHSLRTGHAENDIAGRNWLDEALVNAESLPGELPEGALNSCRALGWPT
jgi:hypothetical protein